MGEEGRLREKGRVCAFNMSHSTSLSIVLTGKKRSKNRKPYHRISDHAKALIQRNISDMFESNTQWYVAH